jgi:hypothetical protein
MTSRTATKRSAKSRVPEPDPTVRRLPLLIVGAVLGVAVAAAVGLIYLLGESGSSAASSGLPRTSDYHSLLVAPADANTLLLGTHQGLFRSVDGGLTWNAASLSGNDAMNLAQPSAGTVWAAGHGVLSRSTDGGATWQEVRPSGLPSLDVHGFAVDPRNSAKLLAAIAGQGLYRSSDGGGSFTLVSRELGPGVMALAILPSGRVLAGDMATSTLAASNDGGATWKPLVQASVMGLAVDPADAKRVLASGPGVLLSIDGGATWRQTLQLKAGTGPVAWSKSSPMIAYVVGFDRSLYRSDNAGATWKQVVAGEGS